MPEEPAKESEGKSDSSPLKEQIAAFLIKAIPVTLASGAGGFIALLNTTDLPKIALGAGIGGVGTLGYSLVAPSLKKAKEGADRVGESGADTLGRTIQGGIARATGAEAKYLEAQSLACQTDRCQGLMQTFKPLLDEIYVPLSLGDQSIRAGYQVDRSEAIAIERLRSRDLTIWLLLKQAETRNTYRQLAILAWGGYGKTTLLKHLAYIYSSQQQSQDDYENVSARIPVLIGLGECWKKYLLEAWEKNPDQLPSLTEVIHQYHLPNLPGEEPPPVAPDWAKSILKQGRAIVLLDGFDEVPKERRALIASWIDRQIRNYDKSIFILTSRPKAYQEEAKTDRLSLRTQLWVEPFNAAQREKFIRKWYLYQERYANGNRDTADVAHMAKQGADELLEEIQSRSEIQDLAKIPLLLNMIAAFHRLSPQAKIPDRRVELYQGIFDLQLKNRPGSKKLETLLPESEAQLVLQRLALEMILNGREKELDKSTLIKRLKTNLEAENEAADSKLFLEQVVQISELLVEKDADTFEFAHWSFQEYLAAKELVRQNQESLLYERFGDLEWKPTILLYAALVKNPNTLIQSMLDRGANDLAFSGLQETTKLLPPGMKAQLEGLTQTVQDSRYANLEKLLQAKQWREADHETSRLMITTVGKEEGQWFDREDLSNFPCEDLRVLDGLWVRYSEGKWGFSVQKRIWQECGSPGPYNDKTEAQWEQFGDRVGWRKDGNWLEYKKLALTNTGELPGFVGLSGLLVVGILFSRVQTCKL
jgi:GUN4-like/NACHT domain